MKRLGLYLGVHGAEPYTVLGGPDGFVHMTIGEAIEHEAQLAAGEANADHLENPSDECRDQFKADVINAATAALTRDGAPVEGASYTDPLGITWTVKAIRDQAAGERPGPAGLPEVPAP